MENKLVKLLAQFYALDHRGKFQFCKESEEACSWVNASSTREIDCRICIQEALDKRDDLDEAKVSDSEALRKGYVLGTRLDAQEALTHLRYH